MKAFTTFFFESFDFDSETWKVSFCYNFDEKEFFCEELYFPPISKQFFLKFDKNIIDNFLFHIHLALWMSYYKIFPTVRLVIKSWYLKEDQILFWKKFYLNGLGEFFITNNIDPKGLLCFENIAHPFQNSPLIRGKWGGFISLHKEKSLLLFWWWKDSFVSYSLIKERNFDLFVFWKLDTVKKESSEIIWKEALVVGRKISENLLRHNELWYYNGHVPITGMIAFISIFYAHIYGYKNIILSNERSANEWNTFWKGIEINHQYSKSYEFEKDFSFYVKEYIVQDIHYFSLLRGMYEYKITEIFSKQQQFFPVFSSCNMNFCLQSSKLEGTKWCNRCPKCAFVFLMLSNFLSLEELVSIFWMNLFDLPECADTFAELIGIKDHKPFECVGTLQECQLSFYSAIERYKNNNFFVLERFKEDIWNRINSTQAKKLKDKLSKIYDDDIIPKDFKILLEK